MRPATPLLSFYGTIQIQKTHWEINQPGDVYSENPVKRQIPLGPLQTGVQEVRHMQQHQQHTQHTIL